MRKEAENWLRQGKADLKTAEDCFRNSDYYAAAFFCQQAVEKSLKGYYIAKKMELPPKTHNLLELSLELAVPDDILKVARELTPEFIISRYPNAAGGVPADLYDEDKAGRLLGMTRRFFSWLEEELKRL